MPGRVHRRAAEDPAAEVSALMERDFQDIWEASRGPELSPEQKRHAVENLLEQRLDYSSLSRAALGPLADDFTREQYADFAVAYSSYLTDMLLRRIARNVDSPDEVKEARYDAEKGLVQIAARGSARREGALQPFQRTVTGQRVPLDLVLRQRHGEWRAVALRIGGVDVSRNFREQFAAALGRSDPDALIADLRARNRANRADNPFEGK